MKPPTATLGLLVAGLMLLGISTGCRDEKPPPSPEPPAVSARIPEQDQTGPVRMNIVLVAGMDSDRLRAGATGRVMFTLQNTSSKPVYMITAMELGKGAEMIMGIPKGAKSSFESMPGRYYEGVGVAKFAYSWEAEGQPVEAGDLAPPDGRFPFPAGETLPILRFIKAPRQAGTYDLYLTLDTSPLSEAWRTYNNSYPGNAAPLIRRMTCAQGVIIVPPEVQGQESGGQRR
jgi:hypothetical protein